MIDFIVGSITHKTSLLGALRHVGVSSTLRRRIKHTGICMVNGQRADTRDFVVAGDHIHVELPEKNHISPEAIPLSIAYEDDYFLIVDKQAGLLMHPTSGNHEGTLANAVAWYYKQTGQHCAFHPVHRLDRNTSGLSMIVKQPHIQHVLSQRHLEYHRYYLALCQGYFPSKEATINWPIARKPDSIIERYVHPGGKPAKTVLTRLGATDMYSLLHVTLYTGRTHQIRVHCSAMGHPLVGDDLYGGTREFLQRQGLHAYCMQFIHPVTKEWKTIFAPLPQDMAALVTRAGWDLRHIPDLRGHYAP